MWRHGTIGIPDKDGNYTVVHFAIKIYNVPSKYGINGGKISKLELKVDNHIIANYDRGWDIPPSSIEAEMALCILLNEHN